MPRKRNRTEGLATRCTRSTRGYRLDIAICDIKARMTRLFSVSSRRPSGILRELPSADLPAGSLKDGLPPPAGLGNAPAGGGELGTTISDLRWGSRRITL